MNKIDEICKYLDAKFSSDGKIQSDIKELFIYRASVPTEFLTGVYEPALCMSVMIFTCTMSSAIC